MRTLASLVVATIAGLLLSLAMVDMTRDAIYYGAALVLALTAIIIGCGYRNSRADA